MTQLKTQGISDHQEITESEWQNHFSRHLVSTNRRSEYGIARPVNCAVQRVCSDVTTSPIQVKLCRSSCQTCGYKEVNSSEMTAWQQMSNSRSATMANSAMRWWARRLGRAIGCSKDIEVADLLFTYITSIKQQCRVLVLVPDRLPPPLPVSHRRRRPIGAH